MLFITNVRLETKAMRHRGIVDQSYMCLWNSPGALTIGLLDTFTKFPAQTSSLKIAPQQIIIIHLSRQKARSFGKKVKTVSYTIQDKVLI